MYIFLHFFINWSRLTRIFLDIISADYSNRIPSPGSKVLVNNY